MRRARTLAALAAAGLAAVLAGCAPPAPHELGPRSGDAGALGGELTIAAAASLAGAFDELAAAFESAHPGLEVRPIEYDGSSTLATQILEGRSVDVFASADEASLAKLVDAGLVAAPGRPFATNTLVVVVPAANPAGIETIADLVDPRLRLVLCDAEVPCGRASRALLERNGLAATPVSLEQNVGAVLAKVAAGEADAGLVYATDAARSRDVSSFVPEHASEVVNVYPIAALDAAPNPAAAAALIAFVTGVEGQSILAAHGFGAP